MEKVEGQEGSEGASEAPTGARILAEAIVDRWVYGDEPECLVEDPAFVF